MNLHRALTHDWSDVPPKQRNSFQRLAARTNGYITPGNIVSLLGFGLVLAGLHYLLVDRIGLGLSLMLIGRLADVFDGLAADITKTKSPIGEALDAVIDKLVAVLALVTLVITALVPIIIAVAFLIHNAINVALIGVGRFRGKRLHPNRTGKLSTATEWFTVIGFSLAYGLWNDWEIVGTIERVLYCASLVAIALAVISVYNYAVQLSRPENE